MVGPIDYHAPFPCLNIASMIDHSNNLPREHLTEDKLNTGCTPTIDIGTDTCITDKHTWVVYIIENFMANAQGFDESTHELENLPKVIVK